MTLEALNCRNDTKKPVIQRTNIISFKTAEFSFLIKKIDVLRVKKINREKIKQVYKYSFKYSVIHIYTFHNPRKKIFEIQEETVKKKKMHKKQKNKKQTKPLLFLKKKSEKYN